MNMDLTVSITGCGILQQKRNHINIFRLIPKQGQNYSIRM